jgi:hypothetical protein
MHLIKEPLGTSNLKGGEVESKHRANRATGKVRPIIDVINKVLEKKEMAVRL